MVHYRRASYTAFLAPIDDEETGEEERQPQPRRGPGITFGKLRTVDTTAVKQVIWPHELVFTPDGQPATYQNRFCMAFVNVYLSTNFTGAHEGLGRSPGAPWPVVRAYHAVWLQHLEQSRATWEDDGIRLMLKRALVWHRVAQATGDPT